MKKYFVYELKKDLAAIGFITLAAVVVYLFPLLINSAHSLTYNNPLGVISSIGGILAVIIPVWIFGYKMKRRSVDLFFALPLSHTKILLVKFLVGLLAVFIPYTAAYWLGAFAVMAKAFKFLDTVWYLPQFFGSIIPIYIIYAISSFVFTRANKLIDGLAFLLFAAFALSLVVAVITRFFPQMSSDDTIAKCYSAFLPFAPLSRVTEVMLGRISRDYYYEQVATSMQIAMGIGFTVNALLAAGATAGLIVTEKHGKAENAGQISESPFGYKIMLPLYSFCLPLLFDLLNLSNLVAVIIIELALFAVTILYKRTIKIGTKQAIIYSVSAVAGIIFAAIISLCLLIF